MAAAAGMPARVQTAAALGPQAERRAAGGGPARTGAPPLNQARQAAACDRHGSGACRTAPDRTATMDQAGGQAAGALGPTRAARTGALNEAGAGALAASVPGRAQKRKPISPAP